MTNEPHRLRSLMFEWRKRAGNACAQFRVYKGGLYCYECDESAQAHEAIRCAAELEALLTEPETLTATVPCAAQRSARDMTSEELAALLNG